MSDRDDKLYDGSDDGHYPWQDVDSDVNSDDEESLTWREVQDDEIEMEELIGKFQTIIGELQAIKEKRYENGMDYFVPQQKSYLDVMFRSMESEAKSFHSKWLETFKSEVHDNITNDHNIMRTDLCKTFENKIKTIIHDAELEFSKEPGLLGQLHPILKGTLGVIAAILTLGMLPLGMHIAKETGHLNHGYVDTFFKETPQADVMKNAFIKAGIKKGLLGDSTNQDDSSKGLLDEIKEKTNPKPPDRVS